MAVCDASAAGEAWPGTRVASLVFVGFVLIVSSVVLVGGWILGSDAFVRLIPSFAAMVPSTALSFFALGVVLLLHHTRRSDRGAIRYVRYAVTAIVAAVALADLLVIATNGAHGIDALLWPHVVAPGDSMSPATAICFLLAAASIALSSGRRPGNDTPFVICATAGLVIAMIANVGYAFDAKVLYQVTAFTAMALHTAITFAFLFLGILLARPESGWLGILLREGRGSAGARRLVPLILLLPFAFAIFGLYSNEAGLFDINFAFCLLAIVTSLLLATAVLQNATVENSAEERLTDTVKDLNVAVADRELLLREVYHRVKNNLQQIIALLHLETARLSDPAAQDAFRETAVRVHALGAVHRLLLSAPSLSTLSTGTFLNELCANIATSFDAERKGIAVHVDADDIPVDIDTAIPLGMLVNELVTNALKHAFEGRSAGKVSVLFKVENDGGAQLTVTDNGNGISGTKSESSRLDGSGRQIVESFVKQIRGVMSLEVTAGTSVTIRIPSGFEGKGEDV